MAQLKRKTSAEQLSSNVVCLQALKNTVAPHQGFKLERQQRIKSALQSLDQNSKMNSRRFLGNLISRNLLQTNLGLVAKLSDYLMFFTRRSLASKAEFFASPAQFNLLLSLIEPSLFLINLMLSAIIKARGEYFKDTSALPVLFRFYAVFNYSVQALHKNNPNNSQVILHFLIFWEFLFELLSLIE